MKLSFEIARSNGVKAAGTGLALRAPYPEDAMRVRAQDIRDFQQFRSLAEKMNRSFDAASADNFTADFKGSYLSPNTEMFPATYTARARGRTLVNNTAHGKGLMRVYADNVVGDDPFELEMAVGKKSADGSFQEEEETNTAIEQWWRRFCRKENFTADRRMDFMEAMRVVEMARAHPGSCLCREYFGFPSEFGFAVRFLEQDRLQEVFTGTSGKDGMFGAGNPIRASREYHKEFDYVLAYWILDKHPGELFSQTPVFQNGKAQAFRVQIPATEIIEFSNLRMRPEQDIGMTELDATILPLWRIHQYDKSLTLSSIASASKPWWIEEAVATGMELPSEIRELIDNYRLNGGVGSTDTGKNPVQTQQGVGTPVTRVSPASREKMPPGMSLKWADPKFPIEAAHDFRLDNLRDVSTATVGSYQQVTGDYQNLGFIAGLMSQQAFQRNMRVRQKSLIEDLRRLFRDALKSSIKSGYFEKRGQEILITRLEEYVDAARFKGQNWPFINPLVEMQTLILGSEAGHLTRQQVQDRLENGMKFSELKAVLEQEMKELDKAGLPYAHEMAANPMISKGGALPPGTEKPEPSGLADGGSAQPTPKSKVARPTARKRGQIDETTRSLIEMSRNGEH
ncbi:MAG: phage portal protein [Patescibacteria group bacterium]|nr:phage portal protein [Patescibacteria group bacterium]